MVGGRDAARDRVERLLDSARAGRSGVLLVRGRPGTGKTALCDDALVAADGITVLRCRGITTESELAYAALGDLFRPVLDLLDSIPPPQATALAGALAIGPADVRDRYTTCAATLSLLAAAAEAEAAPVLVIADGVQSLDPSSAEALLFAARRLEDEGVAILVTARTGEAPLFEQAGFDQVTLDDSDTVAEPAPAPEPAAGADTPDDVLASQLEEGALDARRRGGHAEAASAFERAAGLSRNAEERAGRLAEAANDARRAGQAEQALRLLDEALPLTADPLARAQAQHLRGRVEMWRGGEPGAAELLADEAERVAEPAPEKAVSMLIDAVMLALVSGEVRSAERIAGRAREVSENADGPPVNLAKGALAAVRLIRGEAPPTEASTFLSAAAAGGSSELPGHQLSLFAGAVLTWTERFDEARRLLLQVVERARTSSSPADLPYPLACLAELSFRSGHWTAAYAAATESVRLAQETRQTGALPLCLACLGKIEGAQGRETEGRSHLERAIELAGGSGAVAFAALARGGLGLLELGAGRPEQAAVILDQLGSDLTERGLGEPATIQWAPDLIEALVRCGRSEDAADRLEAFTAQAEATRREWALAAAARCRGLLPGEHDFEQAFAESLARWDGLAMPFERARTELCFGERLRRERHRTESREWLRAAAAGFERLPAIPWLERARTELNASGERLRTGELAATRELTPQELQIALVVATGATNREAGASLFLSPKTIEAHLGRIYRKLGIRSRTELAHLLASEGSLVGAA